MIFIAWRVAGSQCVFRLKYLILENNRFIPLYIIIVAAICQNKRNMYSVHSCVHAGLQREVVGESKNISIFGEWGGQGTGFGGRL